ncbi:MAG: helix-turn-helix transcriptional regulator [Lachnospiraceae bacterium]|nr:helix-turn-helix transcriptional regulator [Lachnospiraceae bacterium]
MQLLVDNGSGFLPISTIKTNRKEYTALIFSSKWTNSAYIYSCIDIADIKDMLIADSDQEGYYFSIARTNGELLYTNLPENLTNYQTLSRNTQVGNLAISVYIDNSVFFQSMKPMYLFLTLYGVTCFALLLVVILLGTKISAKPVLNIIDVLENCKNILSSNTTDLTSPPQPSARPGLLSTNHSSLDSFDYIANSFRQADRQLENYQNVIRTQTQILRARYMEKAISNQLISAKEISQFHSYFPDFPDQFRLALFQLQAYEALDHPPYSNPLLLLQSFLQNELPNIYQQQLSDTELLLLMDNTDFEHCRTILDFLVDNINREEPYYVARCVASKTYDQPEQLSTAYRQLQETEHFIFSDDRTHVCMTDEYPDVTKFPFTMSELITLYNAISYGNREMALSLLNTFSEELKQAPNRWLQKTVYEMIRTILACIKLEHPTELINEYIPEKFSKEDLSLQLCETIGNFCQRLSDSKLSDIEPFAQKILEFIDANYTDPDLCMTTLETHFKCVSSTLRKAFKKATGITITGYIEQKRMERANELLAQNLKPVIEIAIECGYTNQNSFYKAYKRVHGHAPTAYTQTE